MVCDTTQAPMTSALFVTHTQEKVCEVSVGKVMKALQEWEACQHEMERRDTEEPLKIRGKMSRKSCCELQLGSTQLPEASSLSKNLPVIRMQILMGRSARMR